MLHDVKTVNIAYLRESIDRKNYYLILKLIFDSIASLFLIALLSPFFLIIAVLIKIDSRGPVFFKQERLGLQGGKFMLYKFRTMYHDKKCEVTNYYPEELHKTGTMVKNDKDPRITFIGKLLRRTSIDEMPQIINVLKGEMSLIGPRPVVEYQVKPYMNLQYIRSLVKPGMTGMWQVFNRENGSTIFDMIEYDIHYIENLNFRTDLYILLKTIPVVLSGKGAR
jgi:lipopolysaccharide/colanic/teichoic acid biosynthesis glycosyltransferase